MLVRVMAFGCALFVAAWSLQAKEYISDETAIRGVDADMVAALNARDVDSPVGCPTFPTTEPCGRIASRAWSARKLSASTLGGM